MRRFRFRIRTILILVALSSLPCCWIGLTIQARNSELAAIERITKRLPMAKFDSKYAGPDWAWRLGFRPSWMQRTYRADLTGQIGGNGLQVPDVEFNDKDFAVIRRDLQKFPELEKLYMLFARITNHSKPELQSLLQSNQNITFVNLQESGITSSCVRELETEFADVKFPFFH